MIPHVKHDAIVDNDTMITAAKDLRTLLENKKCSDINLLDLRKVSSYLDFFLICTASSHLQSRAVAREIERQMLEAGFTCRVASDYDSDWIIIDIGSLVVHIFTSESRDFYSLDRLWGDADKI